MNHQKYFMKHQFFIWLALLVSSTLAAQEPLAFASGS